MSPDQPFEYVNFWDDEVEDASVEYMERLIGSGFTFSKGVWQSGVELWPIISSTDKTKTKKEKTSRGTFKSNKSAGHPRTKVFDMPESSKPTHHTSKGKQKEAECPPVAKDGNMSTQDFLMAKVDKKLLAFKDELKDDVRNFYAIEKALMKDELLDEIIRALRYGDKFPSPSGKSKFTSPSGKTKFSGPSSPTQTVPPVGSEEPSAEVPIPKKNIDLMDEIHQAAWSNYEGVPDILTNINDVNNDPNVSVILLSFYKSECRLLLNIYYCFPVYCF